MLWLGRVPVEWKVVALRHRYSQCLGKMLDSKRIVGDHLVPYLRNVDVQWGRISTSSLPLMDIPPEEYSRYTLKPGDLLVCEGGEVGRAAIWHGESFVCGFQKALHRLRPIYCEDEPRFMFYMLRVAAASGAFSDGHESTIAHLTGEKLRGHRFVFPGPSEQSAIVRFLDHADRRIQRYIRAKKKLIALLNEQKQAIIQRAVTRGLDPDVRLKPSGVEWLGELPEHWEVMPLRRVTLARCDGPFGAGLKSAHYTSEGIRVIRLQNIGHGVFRDVDRAFISPSHYGSLGNHSVVAGDVLIAGLGDERNPAGRECVAPEDIAPAMVKADCFRFRILQSRLIPEFLALHLTATAFAASAILSTGATRQRTNLQSTTARAICIPPLSEQSEILERIRDETKTINVAVEKETHEIDLLQEFRTRLIADVVTGKLDVREAAARLPEEVQEPEAPEDGGLGAEEAEGEELNGLSEDALA